MKQTFIATALVCATLLIAGTVSAQKTPVAGFSPSLANPQPVNDNVLATDANRLIRWQGWLDVDAFSASILEQMQQQLNAGTIDFGTFDAGEIADVLEKHAEKYPRFRAKANELYENGVVREDLKNLKFYVWLYRHNYTDTGLYQLYVSVRGTIGGTDGDITPSKQYLYRDIQSLGYEFGPAEWDGGSKTPGYPSLDVEFWRGAVVRVSARGRVDTVGVMEEWDNREFDINEIGNIAGVVQGTTRDRRSNAEVEDDVQPAPISEWELAPALPACHFPGGLYIPLNATGPQYKVPVDLRPVGREIRVGASNGVQVQTGEVQYEGRVRTMAYPQPKAPAPARSGKKFSWHR